MPPKKEFLQDCIILKAFIQQKECVKQLKDNNKDSIKKIAGTYFSFPRSLVELEDDDVSSLQFITI